MNLISAKVPNQLVQNGNFENVSKWIAERCSYSISENVATVVDSSASTIFDIYQSSSNFPTIITGHKYFQTAEVKGYSNAEQSRIQFGSNVFQNNISTSFFTKLAQIITATESTWFQVSFIKTNPETTGEICQIKNCMLIDLTELYGAGNEPTTVAQFKADYPLDYYPYNPTSYTGVMLQNGKAVTCDISQMLPTSVGVFNLGNLDWIHIYYGTKYYFQSLVSKGTILLNDYRTGFICDKYLPWESILSSGSITAVPDKTLTIYVGNSAGDYIRVVDSSYTDAASFKQAMQGVLLFYKKATT